MSGLLSAENLNAWYNSRQVLNHVNLNLDECKILSVIGPMGSGKSSLVRCLNRLFEERPGTRVEGQVFFEGQDIYGGSVDVTQLRQKVGTLFPTPSAFLNMSVFENAALGLRLQGLRGGSLIGEKVEKALVKVQLWQEIKDQLHRPAHRLSKGQQQLLCLARVLTLSPRVILMDEPTSVIGLQETLAFEQLLRELSQKVTLLFASNSRKQAARISDKTAFLLDGELIEIGKTSDLFMNPKDSRTEDYLTGRFG